MGIQIKFQLTTISTDNILEIKLNSINSIWDIILMLNNFRIFDFVIVTILFLQIRDLVVTHLIFVYISYQK